MSPGTWPGPGSIWATPWSQHPKLFNGLSIRCSRGTLWIILTNFAIVKMVDTYRKRGLRSIVPWGRNRSAVSIPALVSYQMFVNFREEGETVTVALIQPNLDPYTEKFLPKGKPNTWKNFSGQRMPSSTRKPATSLAPRPLLCSRLMREILLHHLTIVSC